MKKRIVLFTNKHTKLQEFKKIFSLYDIEVVQYISKLPRENEIEKFLLDNSDIIAVMKELTLLNKSKKNIPCDMVDLEMVDHHSILEVFFLNDLILTKKTYKHITEGYLDLSLKNKSCNEISDWEDFFVVKSTHLSYRELQKYGMKVSSRGMTISQFLEDRIHYKEPLNMRHYPQERKEVIDFELSINDFIKKNPYIQNPAVKEVGLHNLFNKVVDTGVFFRSAMNRRQKNYWLPGLNAGIPLTAKKDPIHETTFIIHDFCHFLIPDLIFTGCKSKQHETVYIIHRMMSEASTLVLADMLFVDCLYKDGYDYDYTKRCIYPLFSSLNINFRDKENFKKNLKTLIKANADYCLKGDDSSYRRLLDKCGSSYNTLETFKEKYHAYFCEDYKWTKRNWSCMSSFSEIFERWWASVSPLVSRYEIDLVTIDDFLSDHTFDFSDNDSVIDVMVNSIIDNQIMSFFEETTLSDKRSYQKKAFIRYIMGQLMIFEKFDFVQSASIYKNKIMDHLMGDYFDGSIESINKIRKFYCDFLTEILNKNLISKDDFNTYTDIYPLFDPYFVFYDKVDGNFPELTLLYKDILPKAA